MQNVVLYGSNGEKIAFTYLSERGKPVIREHAFEGIIPNLERRYRETDSLMVREELAKYLNDKPCPECQGTRLKREARHVKNTNHILSKTIVTEAERTGRGLSLEELKGIRNRVRLRKPQRVALHSWAFARLGDFIVYKAKRAGVPLVFVDPAYTSQTCAECGHVDKRNRVDQGLFICRGCGVVAHADRNASHNIATLNHHDWDSGSSLLCRAYVCRTDCHDNVYIETRQLGGERALALAFPFPSSPFNDNIFPLNIPKLAQALPECLRASRSGGVAGQVSDTGNFCGGLSVSSP